MNLPSDWKRLLDLAVRQIEAVGATVGQELNWSLGGGTALALHLAHRASHDIDIFLADRQWLPYFNPDVADWPPELIPDDETGDGAVFRKLVYEGLGEIDYIIAAPVTEAAWDYCEVGGRNIPLETIEEIVAKKIVYRGQNLRPRDVFDLAAAFRRNVHVDASGYGRIALTQYDEAIASTERLNDEFVEAAISALDLSEAFWGDYSGLRTEVIEELRRIKFQAALAQ